VAGAGELIGRDEERSVIARHLSEGRGVVIIGESGVGKTRLMNEMLESIAVAGGAVASVAATRAVASVPLGAFAHLLPPLDVSPTSLLSVLTRASEHLRGLASGGPLTIAVDDAHLLDDVSAALLLQLASNRDAVPIVTVRTGEAQPDPIVALWKDGTTDRLDLQALGPAEATQLAESILVGHLDVATAHWLTQTSAGNPLFLTELIRAGLDQGGLVCSEGVWSRVQPVARGDRLADLVEERLGGLNEGARDVVEVLALGEPLPVELLEAACATSAIHDVERRGLLANSGPDEAVRLVHPLYGELLRNRMGTLRKRAISARLAAATTRMPDAIDVLRLATWQLEGGGPRDPSVMERAAERAIFRFDQALAERLCVAALDAGASFASLALLGESLYWQCRYEEALVVLRDADVDAAAPPERLRAAMAHASTLFWGFGDRGAAERVLAAAAAVLPAREQEEVHTHVATIAMFNGDIVGALAIAEPLLARDDIDDRARLRALVAGVVSLALRDEPAAAAEQAMEGLGLALQFADTESTAAGGLLVGQCLSLWLAGELAALEGVAEAAYAMTASRPEDDFRGIFAFLRGWAILARGRVRSARVQLTEAAVLLRRLDVGRLLPWCLASLARAAALSGDGESASAFMAEADAVAVPEICAWQPEVEMSRAIVLAAAGEHTAATEVLLQSEEWCAARSMDAPRVVIAQELARLGRADLGAPILDRVAADGRLPAVVGAQLAAATGDALDAVAELWVDIGDVLWAAEAAAQAAAAHEADGLARKTGVSRRRAAELRALAEDAISPLLSILDSGVEARLLTGREREVAALAAKGLTRREIAERLFLSARTVANHLNHIYAKLGVSDREGLLAALGEK
jgi:DNA-binding CsgD family transcriptional regulator